MRKIQVYAVLWILVLAVPLTALGIAQAAYLTSRLGEYTGDFIAAITNLGQASSLGGLGWLAEFAARWPEVAGMIAGMLVILLALIVGRGETKDEGEITR